MTLFINSCVRQESRTRILAEHLLSNLNSEYTEINLQNKNLCPLDAESLAKRTELIEAGDYSNPMFDYAKQFAEADTVVIAAPYWDYSFPALLKTYIENIFVNGIVFRYDENGIPQGLCKCKTLYYVTTAGGPYCPDFSFGYIKALAENMLGIEKTELIKAEMLDIVGNNPEKIIRTAIEEINRIL